MPRVASAFLCNLAEIRGGTVSVLSAFVNQMSVASLPARGQLTLVVNLEIEDDDYDQAHILVVKVSFGEEEVLARVEMPTPGWTRFPGMDPDLPVSSPLVIPLVLEFRRPGLYWVTLTADGDQLVHLPYKVSVEMPQI
jgi:hypothetical protein